MDDSNAVVETTTGVVGMAEPENNDERTPSSIDSSPEPEVEMEVGVEPTLEPLPPQKRKGGRKPVSTTSVDCYIKINKVTEPTY
jgi:hypothetical protein